MELTFRLESGDVSLTLYAFDAESVLADKAAKSACSSSGRTRKTSWIWCWKC
ncbi:MAG: hypothetical protein ACLS6G_10245 [Christensenellales bacterium]